MTPEERTPRAESLAWSAAVMAVSRFLWNHLVMVGLYWATSQNLLDMIVLTSMVVEGSVRVSNGSGKGLADCEGGQHQGLHCVAHVC